MTIGSNFAFKSNVDGNYNKKILVGEVVRKAGMFTYMKVDGHDEPIAVNNKKVYGA
jgi:hypothetical protein